MSKEILLLEHVEGLGREGDVVHVADGYASNYLLPRGKAAPVNPSTRRLLLKKQAERAERDALERGQAEQRAKQIAKASCTIPMKTTENGRLYGSVTEAQITDALKGQGFVLRKDELRMAQPLQTTGVFEIPVQVHPEVSAVLKVWVVEE